MTNISSMAFAIQNIKAKSRDVVQSTATLDLAFVAVASLVTQER